MKHDMFFQHIDIDSMISDNFYLTDQMKFKIWASGPILVNIIYDA
jgi:hypothetical protein